MTRCHETSQKLECYSVFQIILQDLLDKPTDSVERLLLFDILKEEWSTQHANLMSTLYEVWGNHLMWEKGEETPGTKTVSLSVGHFSNVIFFSI